MRHCRNEMNKNLFLYQFSAVKNHGIKRPNKLVIPAEAEPTPHLMRRIQVPSAGSLFSQGQAWISVFTGMTA
jgi:hypothetical protein